MSRDDDWAMKALEVLDHGLLILAPDLETVLLVNAAATKLLGRANLGDLLEKVQQYVASRTDVRKTPPPVRTTIGDLMVYLRVTPTKGAPPAEVVVLREEALRDGDTFRLLSQRYGISRREFQVLTAIRQGKTNRQIAEELSLSEGTVSVHVHHLLRRFDVPNRTRLVNIVEQLVYRRA